MFELNEHVKPLYEHMYDRSFLEDGIWLIDAEIFNFPYRADCEYTYVLDLDNNIFQIYKNAVPYYSSMEQLIGKYKNREGKYKFEDCDGCIQVLVFESPLDNIPDNWQSEVESVLMEIAQS